MTKVFEIPLVPGQDTYKDSGNAKREVSIQIPGIAFRGVLAVFEVHSRNLVGMELLDHFQSLRGQTCKFWPLRGQNGVK